MAELARFTLKKRNPDVLTCIANLSNDEVFTPPEFAKQMLDTLEKAWADANNGASIWTDSKVTFLDPCTKSGVFLREIVERLTNGLESTIPDLQTRVDHILTKQVFGIGITHLTSLLARRSVYCSKFANGEHSVASSFDDSDGNIWFQSVQHSWIGGIQSVETADINGDPVHKKINGRCKYCGASQSSLERSIESETHAYSFIHTEDVQKFIAEVYGDEMQFDVIIGNPPYQLDTGGSGRQAKPIYHLFVEQAKKLEPRYISMVIPARWYSGGFGLDKFRNQMLADRKLSHLIDFENASEVFPGVDIAGGVCYFLWDNAHDDDCEVTNISRESKVTSTRRLDEFEIFIRHSSAIPIIRKVQESRKKDQGFLDEVVSSIRPFGLPTNYLPRTKGVPCRFIQKIGLQFADPKDISDSSGYLDKWKLLIPKAPIAGQTDFSKPVKFYHDKNAIVAKPGECCTESWIVACAFDSEDEVLAFRSYLFTKTVRFLILQTVISQDVNRKNFRFVPDLGKYKGYYDDNYLRKIWNISESEWKYIDSKISSTGDVSEDV
jgi:site-specific DNA-methyltransferase (adenine-specific)